MTDKKISPLRRRMIEDMTIRNLADSTQTSYVNQMKKFAQFLGHSLDTATNEDVRRYQLHMAKSGYSISSRCIAVAALRFFFNITLERYDIGYLIPSPRRKCRLPRVLSQKEVARLLDAAPTQKARAAMSVAYGAGLRASEIVHLKVADIDGDRKLIRVHQGKGGKDRYVMLSPHLRKILLMWWMSFQTHDWLFPGRKPGTHLSKRGLSFYCASSAKAAKLGKSVSPHMLRHSFATHLLEQGVDIRIIQTLLGHSKIETTTIYTKVAAHVIQKIESPLDLLALVKDKRKPSS